MTIIDIHRTKSVEISVNSNTSSVRARIQMKGASKAYPRPGGTENIVLDNINLTVDDGQFLAIVGPSGCGKSTMLRLISGLSPATGGRVLVSDQEVTEPPADIGFM